MDTEWLKKAIQPKSDQLNACELDKPIVVTITGVKKGNTEQPVILQIDGGRQPYKPCKMMSRVLANENVWGDDPNNWVGKRLKLYCDPKVKYGGEEVGGIRISNVSHIDQPVKVITTISRGRSGVIIVEPLTEEPADNKVDKAIAWLNEVADMPSLDKFDKNLTALIKSASEKDAEDLKQARKAAVERLASKYSCDHPVAERKLK